MLVEQRRPLAARSRPAHADQTRRGRKLGLLDLGHGAEKLHIHLGHGERTVHHRMAQPDGRVHARDLRRAGGDEENTDLVRLKPSAFDRPAPGHHRRQLNRGRLGDDVFHKLRKTLFDQPHARRAGRGDDGPGLDAPFPELLARQVGNQLCGAGDLEHIVKADALETGENIAYILHIMKLSI